MKAIRRERKRTVCTTVSVRKTTAGLRQDFCGKKSAFFRVDNA